MRKTKKTKPQQLLHYLLGMPIGDALHFHCYVMCSNQKDIGPVANRMLDEIEKRYGRIPLPIVMATLLSPEGTELVRAFIEKNPEAKALLEKATDFHMSGFMMDASEPVSQALWELH